MASLTVRNLDELVKAGLRIRAAENGRSMEAEAREILRSSLGVEGGGGGGLGTRIHRRFAGLGGDQLELPSRGEAPRAAELPG